jgi:hypothetical protein
MSTESIIKGFKKFCVQQYEGTENDVLWEEYYTESSFSSEESVGSKEVTLL